MFEDDICVNLSSVLDGKPNYANVPLSELFARPCVSLPEVLDGGLIMLLPFFRSSLLRLGAPLSWHPPESQRSRCTAKTR